MPKRNRFKTTDSAATVPGRATFPQGTYYQPPNWSTVGTNVSTAAFGAAGAPYSGYPTGQSGTFTSGAGVARIPTYTNQGQARGSIASASQQANAGNYAGTMMYQNSERTHVDSYKMPTGSFMGAGGSANVASQFPWLNSASNGSANPQGGYNPLAATLQYGQYINGQGNVQRGTTPFGVNAQGQRLNNQGDVFDPATAKRDIYGGRFIQVGEKRWERNKNGRLVQVQYLGGGKKKEFGRRGGQSEQGAPPELKRNPSRRTNEQFVSFRA